MIVTHTHIIPPTYCGTWKTADILLIAIGAKRTPVSEYTERGVPIHSRCDVGNFHLLAFDKATKTIHIDNLYMIGEMVEKFYSCDR